VNGFVEHLHVRYGTTSSCSATDNLHTSQIKTAPAKPFPSVPWQRLLTVEILQLHALRSCLRSLPYRTASQVNSTDFVLGTDHIENTPFQTRTLLLLAYSLPRERVYRVVYRVTAYQRVYTPQYLTIRRHSVSVT
jgi:hypothetical protein